MLITCLCLRLLGHVVKPAVSRPVLSCAPHDGPRGHIYTLRRRQTCTHRQC